MGYWMYAYDACLSPCYVCFISDFAEVPSRGKRLLKIPFTFKRACELYLLYKDPHQTHPLLRKLRNDPSAPCPELSFHHPRANPKVNEHLAKTQPRTSWPGRVVWAGVTAPNAQTFRVFGALVSKNCLNCVRSPSEEGRKRVTRARARPLLLKCAFT